jgi:hypothetical protein
LREAALGSELVARADVLAARLREFVIPAYVLETDDESLVVEVFARINTTGRRLESTEVFDAIHRSHGVTVESVVDGLRTVGLGRVAPKDVERAALLVGKKDPGRPLIEQVSPDAAPNLLQDTSRALALALEFLRADAGIPHLELLPYSATLSILAQFFHRFPAPHPRTRELLVRWLWRGALHGTHARGVVTLRAAAHAAGGDEHQTVVSLLALVPATTPPAITSERRYDFGHAATKLTLATMAASHPRLFASGTSVPLRELFERALDDAKPIPVVRALGEKARVRGHDSISGRLLLPHAAPRDVRRQIEVEEDEAVLASHFLSRDAQAALRRDDLQGFIDLRGAVLHDWVEKTAALRARWNAVDRDRPALESFFGTDAA